MATIPLRELEDRLVESATGRLNQIGRKVLAAATVDLQAEARRNIGSRLKERSRSLLMSLRHELREAGDGLLEGTVRVGGDWQGLQVPYARIHEYGGTIVPRNAKFLTIPVGEALNSVGLAKYRSVRDMPFAEFRKAGHSKYRNAQWVVVDRRNENVWYVLVPSVRIKEQRFLRDALDTTMQSFPQRLAEAAAAGVVAE